MQFSLQTDYALRTLMYLGSVGGRATVKDIASYFHISADHLAKVAGQLNRLAYVRALRGVGGGLELARTPAAISVGEVVAAFEGNLHLLECVGRDGVCVIESFCKLRGVLAEAERLQIEYLRSVSLADVLPGRRQLNRVLPDHEKGRT